VNRRPLAIAVAVLGLASLVALALAARHAPAAAIADAVRSVRPLPALLAVVAFLPNHAVRIWRFRVLLGPDAPLGRVVHACLVGFFAILAMPLRLGELVRPAALARDGVPLERSLAALLVERALDLLALLGLLAWTGLAVDLSGGLVVSGVDVLAAGQRTVGTLALILAFGLVAVAVAGPSLSTRLPSWAAPIGRFAEALRALGRDPARAAATLALTLLCWATAALYVGAGLAAMPGLPSDPRAATVTLTAILAATTVLPTPGLFGSYEAGAVEALRLLGGDAASAFAFALLLHVAYLAFVALMGAAAMVFDASRSRAGRRS
jgi:uncharacterized membrane protein YbhN (UPF0104 family)